MCKNIDKKKRENWIGKAKIFGERKQIYSVVAWECGFIAEGIILVSLYNAGISRIARETTPT